MNKIKWSYDKEKKLWESDDYYIVFNKYKKWELCFGNYYSYSVNYGHFKKIKSAKTVAELLRNG